MTSVSSGCLYFTWTGENAANRFLVVIVPYRIMDPEVGQAVQMLLNICSVEHDLSQIAQGTELAGYRAGDFQLDNCRRVDWCRCASS